MGQERMYVTMDDFTEVIKDYVTTKIKIIVFSFVFFSCFFCNLIRWSHPFT